MKYSPKRRSLHGRIKAALNSDIFGGSLVLGATILALILANSPLAPAYQALRDFRLGIPQLHLSLSVGQWASDGLLTIFFFVVGLELKEEFVIGRLRNPRTALLPIAAACGGVLMPALLYVLVNHSGGQEALQGWATPTATDIAFSVALLALVGRRLPTALRVFLLTLAVVDDFIAIIIIAAVYTEEVNLVWLALAFIPLIIFAVLLRRGIHAWWILLPLALLTWGLTHASGIHPTIAGAALGFTVPIVVTTPSYSAPKEMTQYFIRRWSPISTLVAVPVFAFFSAGVTIGGFSGLGEALRDPVALGIIIGLVLGKPLGILSTTFLLTRIPSLELTPALRWRHLIGMSFVAGIGFTVSLLVSELSFGVGSTVGSHATIGVLAGSLLAGLIGAAILAPQHH